MNLVSTMIGMSIIATASPGVVTMTLAPLEAAKRAENFGVAETAAVVFAAQYEGTLDVPENTDTCIARGGTEMYSVTCTHGSVEYVQSGISLPSSCSDKD